MRPRNVVTAVAALIAAVAIALQYGLNAFVNQLSGPDGFPGWAPTLETVGQTVMLYLNLGRAVSFGLTVLGVAALGYWAGQRLDVAESYRSLFWRLAGGGAAGYLLGSVVAVGVAGGWSWPGIGSTAAMDLLGIGALVGSLVSVGVQFGLIGLAGAALAAFGFRPGLPGSGAPSADPAAEPGIE